VIAARQNDAEGVIKINPIGARRFIPKGLNHSARGCEARATPGTRTENIINPEGVEWYGVMGAGDATLSGLMKFVGR
jgi:hypothetical protein